MIKNEMRNWTELAEIEFINNRWRYVVPYVIKPKFSGKSAKEWGRMSPGPKPASDEDWISRIRPQIEEAVKFYEATNFYFREYSRTDIDDGLFDNKQYLVISDFYDTSSSGCTSAVGPADVADHIEVDVERCRKNAGDGDYYPGMIAHEFMHVLGFMHEHQRPDRDEYLKVDPKKARDDPANYAIDEQGKILTDYDPESITHYGEDQFIKINSAHPKSADMKLIGQQEKLSALDVQQININYPITVSDKLNSLVKTNAKQAKAIARQEKENAALKVTLEQVVSKNAALKVTLEQVVSAVKALQDKAATKDTVDKLEVKVDAKISNQAAAIEKINNSVEKTAREVSQKQISSPNYVGAVMMWRGTTYSIPSGWRLCNGQYGTPDLKDKFVIGITDNYSRGSTGGTNYQRLNTYNLPRHSHGMNHAGNHRHQYGYGRFYQKGDRHGISPLRYMNDIYGYRQEDYSQSNIMEYAGDHVHTISETGSGGSFDNRPKFYALMFIMRVD